MEYIIFKISKKMMVLTRIEIITFIATYIFNEKERKRCKNIPLNCSSNVNTKRFECTYIRRYRKY